MLAGMQGPHEVAKSADNICTILAIVWIGRTDAEGFSIFTALFTAAFHEFPTVKFSKHPEIFRI